MKKIALGLSGGGFRAAFFHLGAMYALANQGKMKDVDLFVTVSGGSIAAAMYFKKLSDKKFIWRGGCCDYEMAIFDAFIDLCKISRINPINKALTSIRALSRLISDVEVGFRSAMERQYAEFCNDIDYKKNGWYLPEWRIAMSDYSKGKRIYAVYNGKSKEKDYYINGSEIKISDAVSASSAVPLVFEPLLYKDYILSDGGILDNLGAKELSSEKDRKIICIDASAPLLSIKKQSTWTAPYRSMKILMEQVRLESKNDPSIDFFSSSIDGESWRKDVANIRTDLGCFSTLECDLLFLAGYQSVTDDASLPKNLININSSKFLKLWEFMSNRKNINSSLYKKVVDHLKKFSFYNFTFSRFIGLLALYYMRATIIWSGFLFFVIAYIFMRMAMDVGYSSQIIIWCLCIFIVAISRGRCGDIKIFDVFRILLFSPLILPLMILAKLIRLIGFSLSERDSGHFIREKIIKSK